LSSESLDRAKIIAAVALDGLAEDAVILDMRRVASFCDFFVICEGRSPLHVEAIHDRIVEETSRHGFAPYHREGGRNATWIVLDYGDIVVHIFDERTRAFYDLEALWADAGQIEVDSQSGAADPRRN
jgi:ribosome-associated protein